MRKLRDFYPDPILMGILLLIFLFGEFTILSIKVFPYLFDGISLESLRRPVLHILAFTGGLFLASFISRKFNYKQVNDKQLVYTLIFLSVFLLLVVLAKKFALQMPVNRWLIGTSVQPSELSKLILIIFVAYYIANKGNINRLSYFSWVILITALHSLLLFLQPDKGMAIFIMVSTFILLWYGGTSPRIYMTAGGIFLILGYLMLSFGGVYVEKRISAWMNPLEDPYDSGYHILQSFLSYINGGIFGMGPGFGLQKLGYLTQADTDYILAIIGEEMGFLGILFLSFLYVLFISRLIYISGKVLDTFGKIIVVGITINLMLSILISYAMSINLLPPKGIPLPFVSYGVSNMLSNMIGIGIIGAIYRGQITYDIDRI
jgi:cell division protein FtsW